MLEVSGLCAERGERVLFRDLELQLAAGELLHLHGHNGSGKTTLLRMLCGLLLPAEGVIRWRGEDIRDLGENYTGELLYLGHKRALKEDLTALENLRICCVLDGNPVSEAEGWEALEQIGLAGFEDLPCRVLSQGQKKRVALARLLVTKTRLWLLDEPFNALDKAAVELLQGVIQRHVESGGLVLLTTHQEVRLTRGQVKGLQLGKVEPKDV